MTTNRKKARYVPAGEKDGISVEWIVGQYDKYGLLSEDKGVVLDMKKLAECPFCSYHNGNILEMADHCEEQHKQEMDEKVLKIYIKEEIARIEREQERGDSDKWIKE